MVLASSNGGVERRVHCTIITVCATDQLSDKEDSSSRSRRRLRRRRRSSM